MQEVLSIKKTYDVIMAPPLWQVHRGLFPVTQSLIYLNHAAVAPLPTPVSSAMKGLAEDATLFGSLHYDQWLSAYEGLRAAAARMIGASAAEVAIVKNTSEGISTVARGIRWCSGDRVICFEGEFPANSMPWLRLESEGVRVESLSPQAPLDAIDRAANGARLLAISFVQYVSGHRANLEAIGEICRRRGCLFFVDAIQGMGAFPIDVGVSRIDALSADGHKWMLGPEGCGILFVRSGVQDEIEPAEVGWTNFARYWAYDSAQTSFRPDAGRYECGTLNTIGCFGLRAALELLLEIGIEPIGSAVVDLTNRLAAGAAAKGYELLGARSPSTAAGIVSVRKSGVDSAAVVRQLRDRRVLAAARNGWIRFSPHFYLSPSEIDQAIDALP